MRVLVIIERSPVQRFLVLLHTKKLVNEVKKLIGRRRHSQAIATALAKGRFEGVVADSGVPWVNAELILTEESAHWDLT